MEDPSAPEENSRRRQDGALRREVAAVRRMVRHAEELSRWRIDHRRFGKLPRFAAAQRHAPGDEERHAGGRDDVRGAESRRYLRENAVRLSQESRTELHQKRVVAGTQFSPVVSAWDAWRILPHRAAAGVWRARA